VQATIDLLQHNAHEEHEDSQRVNDAILALENSSHEIGPVSHSLAQLTWSPSWIPAVHSTRLSNSLVKNAAGSSSMISVDGGARGSSNNQVDALGRTVFQSRILPRGESFHRKDVGQHGQSGISAPPSMAGSTRGGRLTALVLSLALAGAVPVLTLIRQQSPPWSTWSGTGADSCRRASSPVLSAGHSDSLPGTASVRSSIINLTKCMVGCTVLALSAGIASFSSAPGGVVPALLMLGLFTMASGYTFSLTARVVNEVGSSTYTDTWAKLFGKSTAFLVRAAVIFETAVTGLSYSIILGDSLASVACLAGLEGIFCLPNTWIYGISAFLLFPLSLPRKLSSFAFGSVIGTIGVGYTALFMMLRAVDRSYDAGGKFHELIAENARPLFAAATSSRSLFNPSLLVLISMLSLGLSVHYTAPIFFRELKQPEDGSSKEKAFNKVVKRSFGLSALLFAAIMAAGYLTFGGASQGLILNSYATEDHLAFFARIGNCLSIIFAYPLNFVMLRKGLIDMFKLDGSKTIIHVPATFILICLMNGLSLLLKDLGLVSAIGGALGGTAVVYIFPSFMFIQATRLKIKKLEAEGRQLPAGRLREMYANYGLIGLGVSLAVLGVHMSLKGALSH